MDGKRGPLEGWGHFRLGLAGFIFGGFPRPEFFPHFHNTGGSDGGLFAGFGNLFRLEGVEENLRVEDRQSRGTADPAGDCSVDDQGKRKSGKVRPRPPQIRPGYAPFQPEIRPIAFILPVRSVAMGPRFACFLFVYRDIE